MQNNKPSILRPWLKHYNPEYIDRPLPKCSMYGMLKECSSIDADRTAIEYYGSHISYREMMDKIEQYAAAFSELGIREGEYVTFLTVTIPETIYSIYGLNKIGAVCNLIDVRTDPGYISDCVTKAGSEVLIVLDSMYYKAADHIDNLGIRKVIVQSAADSLPFLKRLLYRSDIPATPDYGDSRFIRNRDLLKLGSGREVPEIAYVPDRPAAVVRTGGVTGTPKGVVLTNDNLNAVFANFKDVVEVEDPDKSLLNFLPLAASYGIACGIHMALCMHARDILIPKFSPQEFPDLVYKHKPKYIIGVPILYEELMHSDKMKDFDLSFIMAMAAGGDTANEAFEHKLREFTREHGVKYPLAQGYGMSETSSAAAFGVFNIHRDGSAGVPCIHTIISTFKPGTTEELDIGEMGEICITGPILMKEYLGEPEETSQVMWEHPDGRIWVHSGDVGYIDEDGFLFIKGRMKRSIIRFDGHKVYPLQIEEVVSSHPEIRKCVVTGVRDLSHEQGELPMIFAEIEIRDDGDEEALRGEIMSLCRERLEERGQPSGVIFVDKLPVTNGGKIDIQKLTEVYHEKQQDQ